MTGQLALQVEPTLTFVCRRWDGTAFAAIPVEGSWHEAECWAYLAFVNDKRDHPECWGQAVRTESTAEHERAEDEEEHRMVDERAAQPESTKEREQP